MNEDNFTFRKTLVVFLCFFLHACMLDAWVEDESLNQTMQCVDTRDGEKFTFNTNDIKNAKMSTSGSSFHFDVIDANGKMWMVTELSESWLKCHPQK